MISHDIATPALTFFSACSLLSLWIDPDIKNMATIGETRYFINRAMAKVFGTIGLIGLLLVSIFGT